MKIKILLLLLLPVFAFSQTGMVTYDTTINGRYFLITMPDNWWTTANTQYTEGFVALHGMGEVYDAANGGNTGKMNDYFFHYYIQTLGTWDGKVTLGNGVHRPVYISFQRLPGDASGNMRPSPFKAIIDMIKLRWRIKENAMYAIGGSQGSWVEMVGASYKATTADTSYYKMFKAIVSIDGVIPSDRFDQTLAYPNKFGNMARYGTKVLGFQQINDDSRKTDVWIKNMNDSFPGSGRYIITNINGGNHYGGVNTISDPNQRNWTSSNGSLVASKSGRVMSSNYIDGGQNIYEWLMRQGDTTLSGGTAPPNQPPIVSVGSDVTITLPTNSTGNKTMTVTDEGGTLTYAWTKISGPSTFTITAPTSATSNFTNLVAGTYVFRGTATDTGSLSGYDEFQVTVNAAGNTPPVVSAGSDQVITLPTNTATLTGTATDADGTISSRSWSQVSGPNTSTIASPTSASTAISNLIQGVYSFRFAATDNSGSTVADTMTVTVNAAQTGEEQSVFVNLYGGSNPYSNAEWNNWNTTASTTITNLKYITGVTSTIGATISTQLSVSENTSPYTGVIMPTEVLRYASYTTAPRTLTITGLNPGKQYTFVLVASRKNTDNTTNFTIGGVTRGVYINNNLTNAATFTDITPSGAGEVVVSIDRVTTNGGNYLNGFKIIQQGTGQTTNDPPIAHAGAEQFITLPRDTADLAGSAVDYDGVIVSYQWTPVSGPELATIDNPTSQNTRVRGLTTAGDYVFELTATDDDGAIGKDSVVIHVNDAGVTPVTVSAGRDSSLALAQWNDVIKAMDVTKTTLKGAGTGVTTWAWSQIAGASVTIVSPNSQNTLVTGFQPGNYKFRLVASNGVNTVSDTVEYRVADYQTKGERPCRVGAPVTHVLTPTNNTELVRTYLVRDGWNIMGGDTVKIPRNPNNGGVYSGISLGDFGGKRECPVILVNQGIVEIGNGNNSSFFRIGNSAADTNFVAQVKILGNTVPGIPYGFRHIDPTPATKNATGIVLNLATDIHMEGIFVRGASTGVMAKLDSDSARPWRIYNNFRMKNIVIQNCFFADINGETIYGGHTSPNGDPVSQPANNGHTVRVDTMIIRRNIGDGSTWDIFQVSNSIYADVSENIGLRGGSNNQSSQRAAAIIGGNTKGKFTRNVIQNSMEGLGVYGYDTVEIAYNFMDSINAGSGTSDGIYASSNFATVIEPRDSLKLWVHHNYFSRIERRAAFSANNSGKMGVGRMQYNTVVDATRNLSQMFGSNSNDVISDNTLLTSAPAVTIRRINADGDSPLLRVTKGATTQDFTNAVDILKFLGVLPDEPTEPVEPPAGPRIIKRRFIKFQ